jgi:predicted phosphate transport protein (TIGR00153 family)
MRFSLLPREDKFFEDFNTQADLIAQSARVLREICEDWSDHEAKVKHISELEHLSDEIVHTVVVRLNKTFVTPVDREDIHAITSDLDDILDYIHGCAIRMNLFKIDKPTPQAIELSRVLEKSTEVVVQGVKALPTFSDIGPLTKQIQTLEKEGDAIYRKALADLFDTGDPIFIIKWKEIYDNFETAIDSCEDVYDVLEGVVLKHA